MATKYPKHKLVIRDKEINIGNGIIIEEDLDTIFITGTIDLPAIDIGSWSTIGLAKYDAFKIYFDFFDNAVDRDNATISDLKLIFNGYIDTLPVSEDKSSGLNYNSLNFKSPIALAWERSATIPFTSLPIPDIINQGLEETALDQYINNVEYDSSLPYWFAPKIDSTNFFGSVLEQIKNKYAIQIYQKGNGTLSIKRPSSFFDDARTIYEYDLKINIFNIDYGDITQKVDSVVVLGLNTVGIAFDPVAYQLRLGQTPTGETIVPDASKLNPLFIIRRDLLGPESCQLLAREKLVDLAKNYAINFDCVYDPDQQIGSMFVIKNSSIIDENQKWIIKKRTIKISKDDINCNIVAYSNSIQDLPTDILLSSTGVLDSDILSLEDRDVSAMVIE